MLEEVTQRDIRTAVNRAFPGLADWFEDARNSLYRTLWVGKLNIFDGGYIEATVKPITDQLEAEQPEPPDVVTMARLYALVSAAYHDAWLECHVSGATAELEGLPTPPGWSDIS